MAKIFEFKAGSWIDQVTGELPSNKLGEFKKTEKGVALKTIGSPAIGTTYGTGYNVDSVVTMIVNIKLEVAVQSYAGILGKWQTGSGADGSYTVYRTKSANLLQLAIAQTDDVIKIASFSLNNHIGKFIQIISIADGTNINLFVNNNLKDSIPYNGTIKSTNNPLGVHYNSSVVRGVNAYNTYSAVYDHAFTEQERNAAYKDFLLSSPITRGNINTKYILPKPIDLSNEGGLQLAYSFHPNTVKSDKVLDISGNDNDGTIVGTPQLTKDGVKFDGVNDYVKTPHNTSLNPNDADLTILSRILTRDTNYQTIFFKRDGTGQTANGYGVVISGVGTILYLGDGENGSAISVPKILTDGKLHTVILKVEKASNKASLYVDTVKVIADVDISLIGTINTTQDLVVGKLSYTNNFRFKGFIEDVKMYNRAFSEQDIKDYHNSFIKLEVIERFEDNPVGSTNPIGWVKGSGEHVIKEKTDKTKHLECTSAGIKAFQSNVAYGEWEFDIEPVGVANKSIAFISDNPNTTVATADKKYQIDRLSNGLLRLNRGGISNLFTSAPDYLALNKCYRIKITRTSVGEFTAWIKGGDFGNTYQLVDVTGGSGSNPLTDNTYTESKFFVADLDAGDSIANIEITNGVKQL